LLEAISVEDMQAIVKQLITKAKNGDIPAIKELFDRALGKPHQTHEVDVEVKTYSQEQCDSIRKMLASRCVNAES
jgi:ferritin-like protein